MAVVLTALTAAIGSACSAAAAGPPHIDVDRTPCAHCGMLISEPVYAAAYRAQGLEPRVFDDVRCLLEAARREPRADALRFWFHDAASAVWIDGNDAVFVTSPNLRTPMGGGLIAYRELAAAREAAARHQGRIVRPLEELEPQATSGKEGGS